MAELRMAPGLKMFVLIWATNVPSFMLLSQSAQLFQRYAVLLAIDGLDIYMFDTLLIGWGVSLVWGCYSSEQIVSYLWFPQI